MSKKATNPRPWRSYRPGMPLQEIFYDVLLADGRMIDHTYLYLSTTHCYFNGRRVSLEGASIRRTMVQQKPLAAAGRCPSRRRVAPQFRVGDTVVHATRGEGVVMGYFVPVGQEVAFFDGGGTGGTRRLSFDLEGENISHDEFGLSRAGLTSLEILARHPECFGPRQLVKAVLSVHFLGQRFKGDPDGAARVEPRYLTLRSRPQIKSVGQQICGIDRRSHISVVASSPQAARLAIADAKMTHNFAAHKTAQPTI